MNNIGLSEVLFWILFIVTNFSDASNTKLVREPSHKQLSFVEINQSNLAWSSLTAPPLTTISQRSIHDRTATKKLIRPRRRKHRKVTTTIPSPIIAYEPSVAEYVNDTVVKEIRRSKTMGSNKHKNNSIRKHKKRRKKSKNPWIVMEAKNLVLPIIPPETPTISSTAILMSPNRTRCSSNNGGCSHICKHRGPKKCGCFKGFTLAEDGVECIDVDECHVNNGGCQMNCTNTVGSYYCQCPAGFRLGKDWKRCEDINECLLRNGHGPCQDVCHNKYGGYNCSCSRLKGTILGDDFHSCLDVDECGKENGGCSHICINTFGRSFCSCPEGLKLAADFKTCRDIDECQSEQAKIHCPDGCINTLGSYRCAIRVQNDEPSQKLLCNPLNPPRNGFFKCSKKHVPIERGKSAIKYTNLGVKCYLKCSKGFKRTGKQFWIRCGRNGEWNAGFDAKCSKILEGL